jgi:predicted TIM-barrel fold metal-dependent hydrolase
LSRHPRARTGDSAIAIDMHSHFYGAGLDIAMRRRRQAPMLAEEDGVEKLAAMTARFPFTPPYVDLDARRAWMAAQGYSAQLLTYPGALGLDALPAAEAAPVLYAYNDALAGICRANAGTFHGLGGLPLADMDAAAAEMKRLRAELGLLGALLPGNYFTSIAAVDAVRPVLAQADDAGAHILIHPGLIPGETPTPPTADNPGYRASAVQLQATVSQIVLTLILSDLLESYPGIGFQVINLGGTIPFIEERMVSIAEDRTPDKPFPRDRLRRLYYDTASLGPRALAAAVQCFGAERIVLGSDFPIFQGRAPAALLRDAGLTREQQAQIAHGTAQGIIDRLA